MVHPHKFFKDFHHDWGEGNRPEVSQNFQATSFKDRNNDSFFPKRGHMLHLQGFIKNNLK